MSKIFTLDNYKKKADREYTHYTIKVDETTTVTLLNPMRIESEKRERLFDVVDKFQALSDDSSKEEGKWQEVGNDEPTFDAEQLKLLGALLIEVFELVGDENVHALIERVQGDYPVIMAIFHDYFEAVGLGEASSSRD